MLRKPQTLALFYKSVQNLRITRHCQPFLIVPHRGKKDNKSDISTLFSPVPIKPSPDDINIGAELTGSLDKGELLKILNKFTQKKEIRMLCMENGLDSESSCFESSLNLTPFLCQLSCNNKPSQVSAVIASMRKPFRSIFTSQLVIFCKVPGM